MILQLARIVESTRCHLTNEKSTQAELEKAFLGAELKVRREHRLSPRDIPDFLIEGIAVEIKIKGSRQSIYRQLQRYAAHDDVKGILLVSAVSMHLPELINGKPARVASLGRAWL